MRSATLALLTASLATLSLACHDVHLHRRQDRTNEAGEAAITNPATECTYYNFAAVTALQASGAFPAIWEIANLTKASASEKALFTTLNSSIPNIAPRGTSAGNFTGVAYDGNADPDCWWSWKQCTVPKLAGLQPDVVRCPEPNVWGFTLDDGPNCSHNAYYDYLQTINQKATLFYIGSNVVDWPLEAQRGLDDGHEICVHTWSHRYMTALSNEQVFAELYYSKKAIKEVLGITVQCWRPPYGDVDDRVRYIAQALGLATVLWEDNTFDYLYVESSIAAVDKNYKAIFAKQAAGQYNTAGTIVLSHELDNVTMSESKKWLPAMQKNFTHVLPIAVCQNNTNPYVETGYTYPNFAQWAAGTRTISLASATAVSSAVPLSLPLTTGQTGSVFESDLYAAASVGAGSSGTVLSGSAVIVTSTPTGASTRSSAAAASSTSKPAAGSAVRGSLALVAAGVLGGIVVGAAMV